MDAGSAIIVFPDERHLYHPDLAVGWTEYWIGFSGANINKLGKKKIFSPLKPVYRIGYNETMVGGAVMYMLGQLYSSAKQAMVTGEEEEIIHHARMLMRANLETGISPRDIASQLRVSYSRFRKLFKEYTSMAPVQYQIQLKLEKAKEELINTPKSVKEIAFHLNFESSQYFSNLFKEKTTLTPLEFRKSYRRRG